MGKKRSLSLLASIEGASERTLSSTVGSAYAFRFFACSVDLNSDLLQIAQHAKGVGGVGKERKRGREREEERGKRKGEQARRIKIFV